MSYESRWPPFSTPNLPKTGPPFSLESRPVSFSVEKEMDLAPAGQAPPGGTPAPARWHLAGPGGPLAAPTQGDGAPSRRAPRRALPHSAARVANAGGPQIEPQLFSVPQWDGRNGRGWSPNRAESRKPPWMTKNPP